MPFLTLHFLLLFLPLSLLLYWLTPRHLRQAAGVLISGFFVLTCGLLYSGVFVLLSALCFGGSFLFARCGALTGKILIGGLGGLLFGGLLLLRLFDAADTQLVQVSAGYLILQILDYWENIRRRQCSPFTLRRFLLWWLFYPRLLTGPLTGIHLETERQPDASIIGDGLLRYAVGALKILLLYRNLCGLFAMLSAESPAHYSLMMYWVGALAQLLCIWLLLSGCADMAVGLGSCYGIKLREGFAGLLYPSVLTFLRHWNGTVSAWFLAPLRCENKSSVSNRMTRLVSVIVLCSLMGLWTYFSWGGLFYGLLIGLAAGIESLSERNKHSSHFTLTFFIVLFAVLFLSIQNFTAIQQYLLHMLRPHILIPGDADTSLMRIYILPLLLSCLSVLLCGKRLMRLMRTKSTLLNVLHIFKAILTPCLLLLCIAALITLKEPIL